jgi:hypothetical protein
VNQFLKYQAQTSPYPLGMEVSYAKGSYIYDTNNKKNTWFCSRGFGMYARHQPSKPRLLKINGQIPHVMVYGEYSQSPAEYCKLLARSTPIL